MEKALLYITFLVFAVTSHAQTPYQVKSAKIDFVWNNGLSKGTKTLIFDDSGRIEKVTAIQQFNTTINLNEFGFPKELKMGKSVQNSLYIQTKDSVFAIDLDSMVGSSRRRIYFNMESVVPGFEKVGEKEFAGKICDVIQSPFGRSLMWKGIFLNKFYEDAPVPNVYEYATSVDENYLIRSNEFKVPDKVRMK